MVEYLELDRTQQDREQDSNLHCGSCNAEFDPSGPSGWHVGDECPDCGGALKELTERARMQA